MQRMANHYAILSNRFSPCRIGPWETSLSLMPMAANSYLERNGDGTSHPPLRAAALHGKWNAPPMLSRYRSKVNT